MGSLLRLLVNICRNVLRWALGLVGRRAANFIVQRAAEQYPTITCNVDYATEHQYLASFLKDDVGREYGVDRAVKLDLLHQFKKNLQSISTATGFLYHVQLAKEILSIPRSVAGDVVECGCWKGGSTANLSLVCSLTSRKLLVCDSFQGLPEDENSAQHHYPHLKVYGFYQAGMYSGRLDEVKQNIAHFGKIDSCEFVPGFYCDTLKSLKDPIVLAFLDVDLLSSMRDCIRFIWPLLVDGGLIYTDDSCDMEIARIWFDDSWWQNTFQIRSPGYVGSGCGLPFNPEFSSLGYARKVVDPESAFGRVPWLVYPDANGKLNRTA